MPTFRVVSGKGNPVRGTRVQVSFYGALGFGTNSESYTDNAGYVTISGSGTCDISVGGKVVVRKQDISRIREICA